jgi:pantothenate kinase type III
MAPRIIPAMLLALDIGNTNITAGLLRNGALIATRAQRQPRRDRR